VSLKVDVTVISWNVALFIFSSNSYSVTVLYPILFCPVLLRCKDDSNFSCRGCVTLDRITYAQRRSCYISLSELWLMSTQLVSINIKILDRQNLHYITTCLHLLTRDFESFESKEYACTVATARGPIMANHYQLLKHC